MPTSRFVRFPIAFFAFALGTTVLASDPQKAVEEARLRLLIAQQRLLAAQKQKGQPKAAPKPLPPAPTGAMPDGAIARLGDSRLRHAGSATCVAFSPDSRRIFTGGEDGALRVWDTATGAAVSALNLSYAPAAARFTHGGKRLAVAVGDSTVRFLHPETLKQDSTFATGLGNEFAVSSDNRYIATLGAAAQQLTVTGATAQLTVTELATELPKLELPLASQSSNHFAFHPDGKAIAVGVPTGTVTLFRLAGGKPVLSFDHGGPLNGLVFSPDGLRVATGGSAPTDVVKVWDLESAKDGKIAKPVAQIDGASKPQAWIGLARLSMATREGAGVYDLVKQGWVGFVKDIAGSWSISPDGKTLASAGSGTLRVRVWDLTTGKQLHAENDTFPDAAVLAPAADGKSVLVIAGDAAYHWPLEKREASAAGLLPRKGVSASFGSNRLAVATLDQVLIYDDFDPAKGLSAKPSRTLSGVVSTVRSIAVSPDGKQIAYSGETTSANDAKTVIADAATGKTIRVLPTKSIVQGLAFAPDGRTVAGVGRDSWLRLWSLDPRIAEGGEDSDVWRVRVQRAPRAAVAFSPDGNLVATSSASLVKVVSARSGELLFDLDRRDLDDGMFQHVTFSPDSRLLITGSSGLSGAIHVYEVATNSLVRRFTTGFGAVNRVSVFPDGTRIVSAGAEEAITLWDLSFRPGKGVPASDRLMAAWNDLDALDGATGYPATRSLAAGGPAGVRAIGAGVESMIVKQRKIASWIKDLSSEEFADRETATKELLAQGFPALLAVQAAASSAESQEARSRATDILNKLTAKGIALPAHGLAGDTLRLVRAVQVLEDIGGIEPRALLAKIAERGDRPGRDAKAALARLEK